MPRFVPGQRWISDPETELGLGTVLRADARTVMIVYLACGETRTYAAASAPLTRVEFAPGDRVRHHDGWTLTVEATTRDGELLRYRGRDQQGRSAEIGEAELDGELAFSGPLARLRNGQIDEDRWFRLRSATHEQLQRLAQSPVAGLVGARIAAIPHQLYVADEVSRRYAPRVLLADEVGLGKTIEAGLILHRQCLQGHLRRALVLVPDALLYQWLVEMRRRFNLHFALFDDDRLQAWRESQSEDGDAQNPFDTAQLAITSLAQLCADKRLARAALDAEWDMLIVDEAHHLGWAPDAPSLEYSLVEALASTTPGVLLLTATPEQLGEQGHFARLRLLDPQRYSDYAAWRDEEQGYAATAALAEALDSEQPLSESALARLGELLGEQQLTALRSAADDGAARERALAALIDRHGTGRVLFRNTRAAVAGFPARRLHSHPLARRDADHSQPWWRDDPRIDWLGGHLKDSYPDKTLLICAAASTALDIAEALRLRFGIDAPVFHEGLNLIERDRAAAWFAEAEGGARALLASEIGSEGRNFQFARHLVLFDLPESPDLLEQRIGRLDRIGQRHAVQIHLPHFTDGRNARLLRWYHEGLDAVEHSCAIGSAVAAALGERLPAALDGEAPAFEQLLDETRELARAQRARFEAGRDRLLERAACRPRRAAELVAALAAEDRDAQLRDWLELTFDAFGVDSEEHSERAWIISPGNHLQVASFPGLPEEGLTATDDRATALAREDMAFLSWEHPLVQGAIDLICHGERGQVTACAISHPALPPGALLVEALLVVECPAPRQLGVERHLPQTALRLLVDERGRERSAQLGAALDDAQAVPPKVARQIAAARRDALLSIAERARQRAEGRLPALREAALESMREHLGAELARLRALAAINPAVRAEEIEYLTAQHSALTEALGELRLRLDALRLVFAH